jgi:hypothetical protein
MICFPMLLHGTSECVLSVPAAQGRTVQMRYEAHAHWRWSTGESPQKLCKDHDGLVVSTFKQTGLILVLIHVLSTQSQTLKLL